MSEESPKTVGVSVDLPIVEKRKSVSTVKPVQLNPNPMGIASNHSFINRRYEKAKGDDKATTNELSVTSNTPQFIEPPYNLHGLEDLPKDSVTFNSAIETLAVNIDGFGHEFKRTIDVIEVKREVDGNLKRILIDRKTGDPVPPHILQEMAEEKEFLDKFFRYFFTDLTFVEARKIMRKSIKTFGFAGWEILRNPYSGRICGGNIIEDTKTLRLCEKDTKFTPYIQHQKNGCKIEPELRRKRFRLRGQILLKFRANKGKVYFKEFGDPRLINANTGEEIKDPMVLNGFKSLPEGFVEATELYWWKRFDTETEYGVPEIIGALLDVLGVRAAKEVNYNLLKNNTIPPLAIIIQGYDDPMIEQKILDQMNEQIKGEQSRSSALVIQVDGNPVGTGVNQEVITPKIDIVPLAEILTQEGMFLKFIDESENNIASAFRLPPLLVGKMQNTLNRATAETAKKLAEEQVFAPERCEFDDKINRDFLPELGIKYWQLCSLAYREDSSEAKLKALAEGRAGGSMVINEARSVLSSIFPNEHLEPIKEEWADMPFELLKLEAGKAPEPFNEPEEELVIVEPDPEPIEAEELEEVTYDSSIIRALEHGLQKKFGEKYTINKVYKREC